MPSTHISLEELFSNPKYSMSSGEQRKKLIDELRSGGILSISGEWVKANLRHVGERQSLREAIQMLPFSRLEQIVLFAQIDTQHRPIYRVGGTREDGYYTIRMIEDVYEIYHYDTVRDRQRPIEIDPSYWGNSWIDDINWVLVFDNFREFSRREFYHVSFLRTDVERFYKSVPTLNRKGPGRPPFKKDPSVAEYAELILRRQRNILQLEWYVIVKEKFPEIPQKTVFDKLYGPIWTKHHQSQKFRN